MINREDMLELTRRMTPARTSFTRIAGCYVDADGDFEGSFNINFLKLSPSEKTKNLAIAKTIPFAETNRKLKKYEIQPENQKAGSMWQLLMALRDCELKNDALMDTLYDIIMENIRITTPYAIYVFHDNYDIPAKATDKERLGESEEMFPYLSCAICPLVGEYEPGSPTSGFLFPAFDERTTNLYNALYYSRDIGENHPELIDALFRTPPPMPAAVQKETFESLLGETLAEDCSYHVVQAVHSQLRDMIEEHKASKEEQPLLLSKGEVRSVLSSCGVAAPHVDAFEAQYDQAFGPEAGLSPRNLVDPKQLEVRTPDVTIHVNPERSDLVETRMIEGTRYILIRANEGVEVNGVSIQIS